MSMNLREMREAFKAKEQEIGEYVEIEDPTILTNAVNLLDSCQKLLGFLSDKARKKKLSIKDASQMETMSDEICKFLDEYDSDDIEVDFDELNDEEIEWDGE